MNRLALACAVLGVLLLAMTDAASAEVVATPTKVTTMLSGEGKEGEKITVKEGASVGDTATLTGENISTGAGKTGPGKIHYAVYSDKECLHEVVSAGTSTVERSGKQAPSFPVELPPGTYYWRAEYSGNLYNLSSQSTCGDEVETVEAPAVVATPTKITTMLSGEGKERKKITVKEGASVSDTATLTGENISTGPGKTVPGKIHYAVYSDKECLHEVVSAGYSTVEGSGKQEASFPVELPPGTYYWRAEYSGNLYNLPSQSRCGDEVEKVIARHHTGAEGQRTATPLSGGVGR